MREAIEPMKSIPKAPLLCSLGISRATFYRSHERDGARFVPKPASEQIGAGARRPCRIPGRALSTDERQQVRDVLYGEQFVDQTPTQIYATLLEEGAYHCSVRTMYRILEDDGPCISRIRARNHPVYEKPELLATRPNELWSWDITRLKGPRKWTYFQLYVILDVFSRYVVGWMVANRESQQLAKQFIDETIAKQGIEPDTLTVHADRGSAMTSKSVALLLSDLGVIKTHSRPHVSNDNPYSEAHFKTLKYRPQFPDRFGSLQDARAICGKLFRWYNEEHRHGGIAYLTPATVHFGKAEAVIAQRQKALDIAYQAHPERFVNQPPVHPTLPAAVWINPPAESESAANNL